MEVTTCQSQLYFGRRIFVLVRRLDFGKSSTESPFDKLSADEQRLVTSTARAYKISIPQAINEWFEQILGEVDKESGSLWF